MKKKDFYKPAYIAAIIFLLSTCFYSCKSINYGQIPSPSANSDYAQQLSRENHLVDSVTVVQWIDRYKKNPTLAKNASDNAAENSLGYSEAFNKALFLRFFALPNCIGIRIQYGLDENNKIHQIITGVDQSGNDIYIHVNESTPLLKPRGGMPAPVTSGTYAGENGLGCPTVCN